MGPIKFDFATIQIIIFLVIFSIITISMPFTKRNELFGIRTNKTFYSEDIWHKVHLRASILMIPYLIAYIVLLFIQSYALKQSLALMILVLIIITWTLVETFTERKFFDAKAELEKQELELQIKKESGWR